LIQETLTTTAPPSRELPGPRGGIRGAGAERLAAYLEATRLHGDVVCINEEQRNFLISHPDHVKRVLQDNQANYRQNVRKNIVMGAQSLALSAGEAWKQRRRLLQPLFNQQRLAPLAPGVVAGSGRMLDRWMDPARGGAPVDVAAEMADLSLDLLIEGLLGHDGGRGGLRQAVTRAFEHFNARVRIADPLPLWVPTPANLSLVKALRGLSRNVRAAITEHQESGEEGDLLSMMLSTHDERTGQTLNPGQIQDEIMMLLVMGHMTTAMAVTWTFFLLSRHPEAEARVRAEVAEVVGDRPAEFKDVAKLAYTRQVIEETLRLYPPSWSFSRAVIADDEIGGYLIPAGSTVAISPWVTHRRPDLWPDPERFDPGRFEPGRAAERHRFAWYPFGGGPRVCIARDMAMMELPLILATVFQRCRPRPVPGRSAAPTTGIVLRPRDGLWMTPEDPAAAPAARREVPFEPLPAVLVNPAADAPAFLRRAEGGEYVPVPRAEFLDRARRLARALVASGLAPGDRLAIFAAGLDALLMDLAALTAGAVTVPIQPTLEPAEAVRLFRETGALYAAAAPARMKELLPLRGDAPGVRTWIQIGPGAAGDGMVTLASLLEGKTEAPDVPEIAELVRRLKPEQPASLLVTPGTEGEPRAVEVTHGNLSAVVRGVAEALPVRPGEVVLSGLPFARPAERSFLYACLRQGATLAFPGPGDAIDQDLRRVRPHVLTSTPEYWKRFLNWLFQAVQTNTPRRRRIFQKAVQTGRRALPFRIQHKTPPGMERWRLWMAEKTVFAGIRTRRLGGRLRFAVSGGDRIPHGWITFLWAAGIPTYESYGLTETGGFATLNTPAAIQPGSSGVPLPGLEVRVAEDGEILVRGTAVAAGPAVDAEGWLHTGDDGWIDEAGMLSVRGRKSEVFVGPYGKKVSPSGLESLIRSSHFIAHAVVVGEGRPHNAALLVPDLHALQRMAKRRRIEHSTTAELVRHPRVREVIGKEIDGYNERLAAHDQIKAWDLLPDGFSAATGELTSTRTLRRKAVLEKYAPEIEKLYT
jgi:long-subunit acyl-CoA synthetase (AMP-forming)/cytochrome P450